METDAIALNFEDALKKVSKNTKLAFEGIYGTQLTYQNDFKLDGVLLSDLLSGEEEPLHARFDEELEGEWASIVFYTKEELEELPKQNPDFIQAALKSILASLN